MGTKGRVTIISRESDSKTIDVSLLEAELKRRGIEVTTLSKLFTKEKSLAKAAGYIGHVLRQEAAILSSDVVVLDTYCIPASMLPHRPGTKVIQMWHALSAVKKFGWQTVGMEDGSSEKTARLMRMHRGYDYAVCASDITAEHFCEAFKVGRDRIVKAGLPRIDYIKSVSSGSRKADTARKITSAYPHISSDGRRTILYVPTFRRHGSNDAAAENLIKAIREKYDDEFNIVVKLHPLYRGDTSNRDEQDRSAIFDDQFSSYEWLAVADIVISDYSSLVVEATLAGKPLYLYTYDIDEYGRSTGLNVDFGSEPIAPYVFSDAGSLAEAFAEPYDMDRLAEFRDRYIDIDTGDGSDESYCTAHLADFIESLMQTSSSR